MVSFIEGQGKDYSWILFYSCINVWSLCYFLFLFLYKLCLFLYKRGNGRGFTGPAVFLGRDKESENDEKVTQSRGWILID